MPLQASWNLCFVLWQSRKVMAGATSQSKGMSPPWVLPPAQLLSSLPIVPKPHPKQKDCLSLGICPPLLDAPVLL